MIVPVLKRPQNVGPLVWSLGEATEAERASGWEIVPLFVCCRDDLAELAAVYNAGLELVLCGSVADEHQYPVKINAAARWASSEWLFLAADDLRFHPGWLTNAVRAHETSGALVVGTNDLGNPLVLRGKHSTHSLVHRSYLERGTIDETDKLLHEGYHHNGCDVEFVETAAHRNSFAFAVDAVVEHLHPLWKRSIRRDDVYAKGLRFAPADRRLLNERRRLWSARPDPALRRRHVRARPR